jgi:hypothetical protein
MLVASFVLLLKEAPFLPLYQTEQMLVVSKLWLILVIEHIG